MDETILLGQGHQLIELASHKWKQHLAAIPEHQGTRLAFMSTAHRRVRYWVVQELPRTSAPIPPVTIAQALDLPLTQVTTILDDLERHLFFLVRNLQGAVSWAFPVTVEPTPHELKFDTGERVYAA